MLSITSQKVITNIVLMSAEFTISLYANVEPKTVS